MDTIYTDDAVRIILSRGRDATFPKLTCRKIATKNGATWQAESVVNGQAFHVNYTETQFDDFLTNVVSNITYRQINVFGKTADVEHLISKAGKVHSSTTRHDEVNTPTMHNAAKNYLINEGDDVPVLVELGIFTKEHKIVRNMYDKFRQINRFVEILHDKLRDFDGDNINILDFGSGKSYLTFVMYYYFREVRHLDVAITGYDLKRDVVAKCNALAMKYGYERLKFFVKDVTKEALSEDKIDVVVTLHACDTATDYALDFAIKRGVKYIFSVPCCQHEVNAQIKKGGDSDILLNYGLLKERYSALLTDAIRAEVLRECGYKVDVLEFVDFAHSPKNIMLRCVRTTTPTRYFSELQTLANKYSFHQTLLELQTKGN
jgi:hypothetical protein